jgi:esterase/lipase superfamily enzyme
LLSYGQFSIRLPVPRHLGDIPDFIERHVCPPDMDPVYLTGPVPKDGDHFAGTLGEALAKSASKDILVFVHGYNFQFDEAVLWAAQLKHDVGFEGVLVLYSWPSLGSRWSYAADLVNAEWTVPHLTRFLDTLASRVDVGRVHVLAHSMGSKALLSSLHALALERRDTPLPRFGQIILAAPDVDADVFGQLVPPVVPIADRITVYTAADLALRISGWLFAHPRAGDSRNGPLLLDGIDTVDVTSVDDSGTRHDYFLANERVLADIFQLLAHGAPPQRRFRLFSTQLHGLTVWQFRS